MWNRNAKVYALTKNDTHLARCAAAIFLRADADMVRFTGAEPVVSIIATTGCDAFLAFAHLAFCARAILRREAADIIRVGWFACRSVPEPFNDSITEIARSSFSTCDCICLRSSRSSHRLGFPLFPPRVFDSGNKATGPRDVMVGGSSGDLRLNASVFIQ
jgi:hypothetical protein